MGRSAAILLLITCTSVLMLAVALTWFPARDLQRTTRAPQPTSPKTIAALTQFGARFRADSTGRVWHVDIARLPLDDDDLTVLKQLPNLRSLNLRGINEHGGHITDNGLSILRGMRNLRRLNLSANRQLTDAELNHVQFLTRLESLDLAGTGVTDDGLATLIGLQRLKTLNLTSTRITNDGLVNLRKLSRLKTLSLSGFRKGLSQDGLTHLQGSSIEQLKGIDVKRDGLSLAGGLTKLKQYPSGWDDPLDSDLIHLTRLSSLENLRVHLSNGWADTSLLRHLQSLTGLKRLEISGRPVTDTKHDWSGLEVLGQLPRLHQLRLAGVTDEAITHLPDCETLEVLDLTDSLVAGNGFRDGNRFPELEVLTLNRFQVTDESLSELESLPNLQELWLGESFFQKGRYFDDSGGKADENRPAVQMTESGLEQIGRAEQLRVLKLNGFPITDAGLFYLHRLKQLEQLELNGTQITDAGLMRLTALENLKKLSFVGTSVTHDAAARFYESNRRCYIADNWCCGCMDFTPTFDTAKVP